MVVPPSLVLLLLGDAMMDDTHREFVDLLAATELAPEDQLIAQFKALISVGKQKAHVRALC